MPARWENNRHRRTRDVSRFGLAATVLEHLVAIHRSRGIDARHGDGFSRPGRRFVFHSLPLQIGSVERDRFSQGTLAYLGAQPAVEAALRVERFGKCSDGTQSEAKEAADAPEHECIVLKTALSGHPVAAEPTSGDWAAACLMVPSARGQFGDLRTHQYLQAGLCVVFWMRFVNVVGPGPSQPFFGKEHIILEGGNAHHQDAHAAFGAMEHARRNVNHRARAHGMFYSIEAQGSLAVEHVVHLRGDPMVMLLGAIDIHDVYPCCDIGIAVADQTIPPTASTAFTPHLVRVADQCR